MNNKQNHPGSSGKKLSAIFLTLGSTSDSGLWQHWKITKGYITPYGSMKSKPARNVEMGQKRGKQ